MGLSAVLPVWRSEGPRATASMMAAAPLPQSLRAWDSVRALSRPRPCKRTSATNTAKASASMMHNGLDSAPVASRTRARARSLSLSPCSREKRQNRGRQTRVRRTACLHRPGRWPNAKARLLKVSISTEHHSWRASRCGSLFALSEKRTAQPV